MFTIFQSQASTAAIDHLNNVGWGGDFAEHEAQLRVMRDVKFRGAEKFTADMFAEYALVAVSHSETLDDVFHVGNVNKAKIKIPGVTMHSISVGDIIIDSVTSKSYMVDNFGFTEIQVN